MNTARIKFPDPNIFIRLHLIDGKDNHSHALVTWNTKMQKKIYIHYGHTAIDDLMNHIKYYNKICEDVRNMEGEDDEPEDETKFLI